MTAQMWFATAMWLLMVLGYLRRHDRRTHVPLVLTAIFGDLALVIYLELTRGAVETALKFELKILQQSHIAVSSLAMLLYFPLLYLGYQLLNGKAQYRSLHRKIALSTLCFRTLGFLFMFSMWKQ